MNCIIIDDELIAREIVADFCETVSGIKVLAKFPNAIEALKYLNKNNETVDLIFLDIHMPGLTGFDFIETLKKPPRVIVTSSDRNFAINAYEYEFIEDYLLKPLVYERFAKSINRIKESIKNSANTQNFGQEEHLYINIDRRLIKINLHEILLVAAQGDYIEIKTTKETYRVHTTLKKIKEKLPDSTFLQIHRSYLINFTKIIDIQDNSVLIEKNVVPISRSNRPELMQRLNLL